MNVAQISVLLGHASIQTTIDYLDIDVDSEAEAMSSLEGAPQEKLWRSGGDGATLTEVCGLG